MKKTTNGTTTNNDSIEHWTNAAMALVAEEVTTPAKPVATSLQEADGVAYFVEKYWEPAKDRPGLRAVAAVLPLKVATEIRELVQASRSLQTQVLYPDDAPPSAWRKALDEGGSIAAELRSALEFVLADGLEDVSDVAFDAASQRDDGSPAALAQALSDYAGIAEKNRGKLGAIEGFDLKMVPRARQLAAAITAEGPQPRRSPSPSVELRNRMLALLEERVAAVRRAARYVFRAQPELVRQVTSEYSRKQRASYRRRRAQAQQPAEVPAPAIDQPMD